MMHGCLRCRWSSVSSRMTSPLRHLHHHHQQETSTRRSDDIDNHNHDDDESSLCTPPLPVSSEPQQFIKAEPMSPSASQHRHVTSAQGHRQGHNTEAAALSSRGHCEGHVQGQTAVHDGSTSVLTSLVGDDASSSSRLSAFTAAATLSSSSSSSSSTVLDTVLSTGTAAVPAKHARLDLNTCVTEWHPLD